MDERRLEDRLRFTISRGTVNLVNDAEGVQRMQIDIGPVGPDGQSMGIRDNTVRAAEFGFASNPPVGADVIVLSVGGDVSNAIVVATNHKGSRPTGLLPGESMQHDDFGNGVHLSATGIDIDVAAGLAVTINAEHVVINSNDIQLGGAGGKKVVLDGDPVVGGAVQASSSKVTAA